MTTVTTIPKLCQAGGLLSIAVGSKLYLYHNGVEVFSYTNDGGEIKAHCISFGGKFLSYSTHEKNVNVLTRSENGSTDAKYVKTGSIITKKNISELKFSPLKESELFLGSLNGEVFSIECSAGNLELTLRLGHVSGLADLIFSPCGKFVCTAIRDEKIRVSQYPETFRIHNYFLGHTNMVNRITFIDKNHVVSGSCDKTVKLWRVVGGDESKPLLQSLEMMKSIQDLDGHGGFCVCVCENDKSIVIFRLVDEHLEEVSKIEFDRVVSSAKIVRSDSNPGGLLLFVLFNKIPNLEIFQVEEDGKLKKSPFLLKIVPFECVPSKREIFSEWGKKK